MRVCRVSISGSRLSTSSSTAWFFGLFRIVIVRRSWATSAFT